MIVIFIRSNEIDLASQGIKEAQAVILRSHLATFADDWDSLEISIYDNYDGAKQIFKRGDVVLVLFPNSSLTTAKTRPALIVQTTN